MAKKNARTTQKSKAAPAAPKAKQLQPNVVGRPGMTVTPPARRRSKLAPFKRGTITTLIKVDQAKGATLPGASRAFALPGEIVSAPAVTVVRQTPMVPVLTGMNKRVIPAPSPTQKAGIRSPWNQKKKAGTGNVGKNTRVQSKR